MPEKTRCGYDIASEVFVTKDEDPTGLLNEGFRYRDLETGTFITRDPLGFVDGPNMYSYVMANPWTMFDPQGLRGKRPSHEEKVQFWKNIGGGAWSGTSRGLVDTADFIKDGFMKKTLAGRLLSLNSSVDNFSNAMSDQAEQMKTEITQTVAQTTGADANSGEFQATQTAGEFTAPGLPAANAASKLNKLNSSAGMASDVSQSSSKVSTDLATDLGFADGQATRMTLDDPLEAVRVHGGKAKKEGNFMTTEKNKSKRTTRNRLALKQEWGNTITKETKVTLPAGTTVMRGKAAPQRQKNGKTLKGGAEQIVVDGEVKKEWFGETKRKK